MTTKPVLDLPKIPEKGQNPSPHQMPVANKSGPRVPRDLFGTRRKHGRAWHVRHLPVRAFPFRRARPVPASRGRWFVPLKIGSRAEDILRVLVERAGELVSKDEIIAKVWPGTTVEESNLTVQISTLRRSLDEKPAAASYIQTVPGRGYRFVAGSSN